MRRVTPGGPLSQFVDCIWVHEGFGGDHALERVLPTATTDLVFAYHPICGTQCSIVTGPRSQSVELNTSQPFSACGVHFKPGGARPFVAVPADELHNRAVSLDTFWGEAAHTLEAQLWEATSLAQRLHVLEEALRTRITPAAVNPAIGYAVDAIERSRGSRPITDITQRIGLSTRRFLDVFRREVGVSPKTFCRMRRFAAVLARLDRAARVEWTEVALSCGYFDQAHFNHEFRAFSGVSPSEYLRSRTSPTHLIVSGESR